jgi:hypothetical protein
VARDADASLHIASRDGIRVGLLELLEYVHQRAVARAEAPISKPI